MTKIRGKIFCAVFPLYDFYVTKLNQSSRLSLIHKKVKKIEELIHIIEWRLKQSKRLKMVGINGFHVQNLNNMGKRNRKSIQNLLKILYLPV